MSRKVRSVCSAHYKLHELKSWTHSHVKPYKTMMLIMEGELLVQSVICEAHEINTVYREILASLNFRVSFLIREKLFREILGGVAHY